MRHKEVRKLISCSLKGWGLGPSSGVCSKTNALVSLWQFITFKPSIKTFQYPESNILSVSVCCLVYKLNGNQNLSPVQSKKLHRMTLHNQHTVDTQYYVECKNELDWVI